MDAPTQPRRFSARDGFTLIEVMLALSILAFGLLALAAAQLYAMDGRASGRHTTKAAALAITQMDELQRRRWTDVVDTGGAWLTQVQSETVQDGAAVQNEQTYNVSWRITNDVAGETRWVDVRITWDEPKRAGRSYTLSSIRFNRENL
ncbi:MAG: prepilin-type N-terminal cleavage/methylation domain-containing protein [Myxococcales bacterium]|nr:prepilin-type N-terminal cleavage/methylation domain-containing protein [Myxococcales bacterium]MDH5308070.1 prepilin-type N-terminal cleavage/methylation domain-containing protein [Myxococcales bacterium]MDH5567468.1 prepilin-type N-terminal cleavage/methylation domain-containing protein [Myxococcales bacterium]